MAAWNYETEVLADAPYLWWRCRESAGPTAADASGNGRDGTYFGTDLAFEQRGIHSDEDSTIVRFNDTAVYDSGVEYSPVAAGFPATELTLEWVQRDPLLGAGRTLWSYCDSGGVQPDTIRVVLSNSSSRIELFINGTAVFFTPPNGWSNNTDALQHFAITWRSSDGRAEFFINGHLMDTDTVGMGFSIPAGGGLVLAQDQDSLLGGYVVTESVEVTAGEFAIYDSVLSAERLRVHASAALTRYVEVDEIPLTIADGGTISKFDIRGEAGSVTNRVWDTVAAGFVRWITATEDSVGASYPGPGTFGSDTSDFCIESRTS